MARPGQISTKTLGYIEKRGGYWPILGFGRGMTSQLKLSADRLHGEHHLPALAAWHGLGTSSSLCGGQVFQGRRQVSGIVRFIGFPTRHDSELDAKS